MLLIHIHCSDKSCNFFQCLALSYIIVICHLHEKQAGCLQVIRDEEKEGVLLSCIQLVFLLPSRCLPAVTQSICISTHKHSLSLFGELQSFLLQLCVSAVFFQNPKHAINVHFNKNKLSKATFGFFLVHVWVWEFFSWFKWVLFVLYGVHFNVKMNLTR